MMPLKYPRYCIKYRYNKVFCCSFTYVLYSFGVFGTLHSVFDIRLINVTLPYLSNKNLYQPFFAILIHILILIKSIKSNCQKQFIILYEMQNSFSNTKHPTDFGIYIYHCFQFVFIQNNPFAINHINLKCILGTHFSGNMPASHTQR